MAMGEVYASQDTLQVVSANSFRQSQVGVWNVKPKSHQPVVVWFHGGMTSNNCSKGLVAGNDLSELLPDYVVISPSACKQDHWVTPVAMGWVDAALDSIAGRRGLPVDTVYLLGVSDGALGAITYSLWGKRQVAARILVSSYGASFGEPQQIAAESRLQAGRWRFLQGGSDRLYPADATVPWITQFCDGVGGGSANGSGARCDLKFDPAGEHDWSYWKNRHLDWILEVFKEK